MARTAITITSCVGAFGTYSAGAADVTFDAADTASGNYWLLKDGDKLLANNTDTGAQTVTIDSVPDTYNREGDITAYSLAAGDIAVFGPFESQGWRQSDGGVYVDASDTAVTLAVIRG